MGKGRCDQQMKACCRWLRAGTRSKGREGRVGETVQGRQQACCRHIQAHMLPGGAMPRQAVQLHGEEGLKASPEPNACLKPSNCPSLKISFLSHAAYHTLPCHAATTDHSRHAVACFAFSSCLVSTPPIQVPQKQWWKKVGERRGRMAPPPGRYGRKGSGGGGGGAGGRQAVVVVGWW